MNPVPNYKNHGNQNKGRRNQQVRESAFALYAAGEPMETIAKIVGTNRATIYNWTKQYKWGERKKEVDKEGLEKANKHLAEIKSRQHKIVEGMLSRFVEQLKADEVDMKATDAIAVLKHELLLSGEAETSTTSTAQEKLLKKMEEWFEK